MNRRKKLLLAALGAVLVLLVLELALLIPYFCAGNTMEAGELALAFRDRRVILSWPESPTADYYRVVVWSSGEEDVLYYDEIHSTNHCDLTELPGGEPMNIEVTSAADYRFLGRDRVRYGGRTLEGRISLTPPRAEDFRVTADLEAGTVSASWQLGPEDVLRISRQGEAGEKTEIRSTTQSEAVFRFGPEGDFPELQHGDSCHLIFDVSRRGEGITYDGGTVGEAPLSRQDFLTRDLKLEFTPVGQHRVRLQWQETKGDAYQVQRITPYDQEWQTVAEISQGEPLVYESGHLEPYVNYAYRVVAVGGQVKEGSEFAAESSVHEYIPQASPIYATVWPDQDLAIYRTPDRQEPFATAPVGQAFCVLAEEKGMFAVRTGREIGYIDSRYCLINLPEYLGRLCAYDVTNSYSSIYLVHEYEIPGVSGQVIPGYEHIRMEDGSFLVPLLYPTAQKLVRAGMTAADWGYRLRIHDAFRPYQATRAIYDQTKDIIHLPIPEKTFTGLEVHDLPKPAGERLTYEEVMTSEGFGLAYFLARGISHHNRGTAMDLTIEDYYSQEAMQMQTSIHDLSHYSAVPENNDFSYILQDIMYSAGFGGLASEWWHFQDNDANKLLAPPHVQEGVRAECWVRDDFGWRYRLENGSFLTGCMQIIGDEAYTFDDAGYALGENP